MFLFSPSGPATTATSSNQYNNLCDSKRMQKQPNTGSGAIVWKVIFSVLSKENPLHFADADDATGQPGTSVTRSQAVWVSTFAEIVRVSVDLQQEKGEGGRLLSVGERRGREAIVSRRREREGGRLSKVIFFTCSRYLDCCSEKLSIVPRLPPPPIIFSLCMGSEGGA